MSLFDNVIAKNESTLDTVYCTDIKTDELYFSNGDYTLYKYDPSINIGGKYTPIVASNSSGYTLTPWEFRIVNKTNVSGGNGSGTYDKDTCHMSAWSAPNTGGTMFAWAWNGEKGPILFTVSMGSATWDLNGKGIVRAPFVRAPNNATNKNNYMLWGTVSNTTEQGYLDTTNHAIRIVHNAYNNYPYVGYRYHDEEGGTAVVSIRKIILESSTQAEYWVDGSEFIIINAGSKNLQIGCQDRTWNATYNPSSGRVTPLQDNEISGCKLLAPGFACTLVKYKTNWFLMGGSFRSFT